MMKHRRLIEVIALVRLAHPIKQSHRQRTVGLTDSRGGSAEEKLTLFKISQCIVLQTRGAEIQSATSDTHCC